MVAQYASRSYHFSSFGASAAPSPSFAPPVGLCGHFSVSISITNDLKYAFTSDLLYLTSPFVPQTTIEDKETAKARSAVDFYFVEQVRQQFSLESSVFPHSYHPLLFTFPSRRTVPHSRPQSHSFRISTFKFEKEDSEKLKDS
jgi:hypothetical protein